MKITQETTGWRPITIVLDSEAEADALISALDYDRNDPVRRELYDTLRYLRHGTTRFGAADIDACTHGADCEVHPGSVEVHNHDPHPNCARRVHDRHWVGTYLCSGGNAR